MSFEEQVRERAYHMWLAEGMSHGRADEHWVCAEQALRGKTADAEPVVILTKTAAKPRKAAAAKPAAKVTVAKANVTKASAKTAAKPVVKAKAAKASAKAGTVQPTAH